MAINRVGRAGRLVLWLSPVFIVPGVIVALLPWLEQQNHAIAQGVTTAAAIFVLGYSLFIASRVNRRLDEVEVTGQRVANTKGMTIGMVAAVLVMLFPPSMNTLVDLATAISAGSPDRAVKHGITIGVIMVVLLQTLGTIAVSIWWERRLGKPA